MKSALHAGRFLFMCTVHTFPQCHGQRRLNVLLDDHQMSSTALEAYWSSVAWPAQGVFIGDPLVAPYRK